MPVVRSSPAAAAKAAHASQCDVLARADRLHPRSRVRATIRTGRRVRSGGIVVHFVPEAGASAHAAVVVGKAVGGSVVRHRRQRQIRHALAAMWTELPGGDLVVRALPGEAGYDDISHDLRRAVGRL